MNELEIRCMEWGICPIGVLWCIKRPFFNIRTVVGQQAYKFTTALYCHCYGSRNVIGHV